MRDTRCFASYIVCLEGFYCILILILLREGVVGLLPAVFPDSLFPFDDE